MGACMEEVSSRPPIIRTASTKPNRHKNSQRAGPGCAGPGPQNTSTRLRSRGNVFSLIAFRSLFDLEFDHLAFVQRLVSVHLDGGEMNEHVFARLALNETIPFRSV